MAAKKTIKVEQVGSPDALYRDPDNLFVAGFIGSPRMNFLKGRISGGRLKLDAGAEFAVGAPDGEVIAGIRPEHFIAAAGGPSLTVTTDVVENLGGTQYLYGAVASGESVIVEMRDGPAVRPAGPVNVGFAADRVLLFSPDGRRLRPSLH